MKRFSEQLQKKAKTLRMSAAERRDLRERLVSYMEYHPLPQEMRGTIPAQPRGLFAYVPSFAVSSFTLQRFVGAFVVILVAVVPFVAERAVPGDVLYPIKVRFNEEVRSSFADSPYAMVEWETERLERRLAEARILESEGKLTPELAAEVAESVKQHSDAAQASIATMRATDSDEAAIAEIALTSALDVQSEMLEGRSEALVGAVDAARKVATESQQTNKPSYERLLGRIEIESTNATELFNTIVDDASTPEKKDIAARLERIRREVTSARNVVETDQEAAVAKLTTALTDLRKAISFMTNIEVRAHVTIADLLPNDDDLTLEEQVRLQLEEVATQEEVIREKLPMVDVNTQAAVTARLSEVAAQMEIASTTFAAGEFEAAGTASAAALTILNEVGNVLTQVIGVPATTTPTHATSTASSASEAS